MRLFQKIAAIVLAIVIVALAALLARAPEEATASQGYYLR